MISDFFHTHSHISFNYYVYILDSEFSVNGIGIMSGPTLLSALVLLPK